MADAFGQGDVDVRLDWGRSGAEAARADIAVVVDVLSFSTAVTVAVGRGMRVVPCPWQDTRASELAAAHDAVVAVGRLRGADPATVGPSLSPARLLSCEFVPRLVLPSPNGSTIAAVLEEQDRPVVIGCLRNARAVAGWLGSLIEAGRSVTVIAAGERWRHDGSLRPALEDQLGAGAILSELMLIGHRERFSPEAWAAATLFDASRDRLADLLHGCVSGRELADMGFADDLDVAADLNASDVVPVLVAGAFERAARGAHDDLADHR